MWFGSKLIALGEWLLDFRQIDLSKVQKSSDSEDNQPLPTVKLSPEAQRMVNEIRNSPPTPPPPREAFPAGSAYARIEEARRRRGGF